MNSWNNEQFIMPNMIGMPPIVQNILPTSGVSANTMPLASPMCMIGDMNMSNSNQNSAQFTGPNNPETKRTYRENNEECNQMIFDDNSRDSDRIRGT